MSHVRFLAPSPLWDDLVVSPAAFRAPALLRFAGDDFIEQYQRTLAAEPGKLGDFVALPETWRVPRAGLSAPPFPGTPPPLRLWQPVHGRFYLVAASLACRVPGLPEHTVDAAAGETVGFVVRRLTVSAQGIEREWAWVKRADGSEGWTPASAAALAGDEEVAPMFATTYPAERKRTRRVFAGLVPASRREVLVNAPELGSDAPPPPPEEEPRLVDFQRAVIDPWAAMEEHWAEVKTRIRRDDGTLDLNAAEHELAAMESSSAMILIDFAEFLERQVSPVWKHVVGTPPQEPLAAGQSELLETLTTRRMWTKEKSPALTWTLREALQNAFARRGEFLDLPIVEATPDNPNPSQPTVPSDFRAVLLVNPDPDSGNEEVRGDFAALLALLTRVPEHGTLLDRPLAARVAAALAEVSTPARPPQLPALPPSPSDERFVVRCVYQRPNCGRKARPVVSERSEPFQLTSFFDPDAPARQLRVALPADTRPATLRKYDRNVAFVLSSELRKQMSRAASLKDLMDGKAGGVKGGLDIGVICSFSIPIITICALILLMILVSLLNIIFWWKPLFKICFPVPKPK